MLAFQNNIFVHVISPESTEPSHTIFDLLFISNREFCKARGNKRELNTALLKWNLPKTHRKMDLIRAANGEQFVPVI